ncbi:DUF4188 domain-containing protein [Piscibacillus halophilus]|uniref:DUF4188 domain-containing protein n=1 Tax=Piscibacillus halophilus TaxID=571933 RepID=A0A1H9MA23_9BACI|nr:DUF4188 domain-containing protein [Piscibacillus halophilus]SER20307.1 protein of unknown function [Piscibacillus halophilus]
MAQKIYTGRYTTNNREDIVVFIIGMRINKYWKVHKWLPVFQAMPKMLRELYEHQKELGFYSHEMTVGVRMVKLVQYWRSMDELLAYSKDDLHLTAWREFNQKIGHTKDVGIFHETYVLQSGSYESVYGNMPVYGLAKALGHEKVNPKKRSASKRIKQY